MEFGDTVARSWKPPLRKEQTSVGRTEPLGWPTGTQRALLPLRLGRSTRHCCGKNSRADRSGALSSCPGGSRTRPALEQAAEKASGALISPPQPKRSPDARTPNLAKVRTRPRD